MIHINLHKYNKNQTNKGILLIMFLKILFHSSTRVIHIFLSVLLSLLVLDLSVRLINWK